MRKKSIYKFLPITIVYFTVLLFAVYLISNKINGGVALFIFLNLVISSIWFIKSIILFFKRKIDLGFVYIFLITVLISALLKISYYYHHFIFGILSSLGLLATLYFGKNRIDKPRLFQQIIPFFVYGILCFSASNIFFHKMFNSNIKVYYESNPYVLDDFKGKSPKEKIYKNLISTEIRYKLNNFGEYPDGIVIVGMNPFESYITEIDTVNDLQSLNDFVKIKEVAARKIRKLIYNKKVKRIHMEDSINSIINYSREIQNKYQRQVFQLNNADVKNETHKKLIKLLKEYDDYE